MHKLMSALALAVCLTPSLPAGASTVAAGNKLSARPSQVKTVTAPSSINMAKQLPSYYTAGENGAASNYYITLVSKEDATYSRELGVQMTDGYALFLDLYAESTSPVSLPEGTYTSSADNGLMTYDNTYSFVSYYDAQGNSDESAMWDLTGDVKVENLGNGNYSVTATFTDGGTVKTVSFQGSLVVTDSSSASNSFPQIRQNLDLNLVAGGYAIYDGNLYDSNTGSMYINLFEKDFESGTGLMKENGYALALQVFGKLFKDSSQAKLDPGVYNMSTNFKRYTWYPGREIEYMGLTGLMGCYARAKSDDGYSYSYLSEGTITIEEVAEGYKITVDAVTTLGHTVKATFTGEVPIYDQSSGNGSSALSTLEDDVELNLKVKTSHLWNYGHKNGHQVYILDIGSPSGRDAEVSNGGDLMRFEFVLPDGSRTLLPGTYTVMDVKAESYYEPYKLGKGYFVTTSTGGSDLSGTRYMHFEEGRYLIMDHYAPAEEGTVGVTQNADGTFKFDIAIVDDAQFNITGTWEGPMELMYNPDDIEVGIDDVTGDSEGVSVIFVDRNTLRITGAGDLSAARLYDAAGREMPLTRSDSECISTASLPEGVYVLCANGKTIKFIKQ